MAEICFSCNKKIGMMGGYKKLDYTGKILCDNCFTKIRTGANKFQSAVSGNKSDAHALYEQLCMSIMNSDFSSEVKSVLVEEYQLMLEEYAKKNEEEQERLETEQIKIQQLQKLQMEKTQIAQQQQYEYTTKLESNYKYINCLPLYEYDVEVITDTVSGQINVKAVRESLSRHSAQHWRLVSTLTNEVGKNAMAIGGLGINATMDNTILIYERQILTEE